MPQQILIVDDAKFIRQILKKFIQSIGFDVVGTAENGEEAIEQYKKLAPDLVTMDITMPKMDGLKATEEIINYDSEAKIITCSAANQKELISKSLKIGAKAFIAKPFNREKISTTLTKVIEESKKFQLEIETVGKGTVYPKSGAYKAEKEITLSTQTEDGYRLKNWLINEQFQTNQQELTIIMDEDKSIVATFDYPLTFKCDKQKYKINENQNLSFTIAVDYFDNQLIDLSYSKLPKRAKLNKINNHQAEFSWQPNYNQAGDYSITFTAQAEEQVKKTTIDIEVKTVKQFDFKFKAEEYNLTKEKITGVYLIGEFNSWGQDSNGELNLANCLELEKEDDCWSNQLTINTYKDLNNNGKCDFKWLVTEKNYLILPEDDLLDLDSSRFTLPDGQGGFNFYLDLNKDYQLDLTEQIIENIYLLFEAETLTEFDKSLALTATDKSHTAWYANFKKINAKAKFNWLLELATDKVSTYPKDNNLTLEEYF